MLLRTDYKKNYLPGTAGAALLMNVLPRVGTEPTALVASSSLEQFPSSSLLARPVSLRRLKVGQGQFFSLKNVI